jgi:hypothetical protein
MAQNLHFWATVTTWKDTGNSQVYRPLCKRIQSTYACLSWMPSIPACPCGRRPHLPSEPGEHHALGAHASHHRRSDPVATILSGTDHHPDQDPLLRTQLGTAPAASLAEHDAQWNADHGSTLSAWTIGRVNRRLGWWRKKDSDRVRTRPVGARRVCASANHAGRDPAGRA